MKAVMDPGTHVTPHCGPTNAKLRCHLGLVVPDSSVIRVADQKIHWRELGCIVFDDSLEHEVWNPDAERAVRRDMGARPNKKKNGYIP